MRLAVMGGRLPSEIRAVATSSDITDLLAYWQLEPWGPWRDNLHAAQIASILFNAHRGRNTKPSRPGDFFYRDPERVAANQRAAFWRGLDRLASESNGD